MERNDDDEGELIAGERGSDVRVTFAGERVALVVSPRAATAPPQRVELTPENAARLAVELELAAESLVHERGRRFTSDAAARFGQNSDTPRGSR